MSLEELKKTLENLKEFFIRHRWIEIFEVIDDHLCLIEDLLSIKEVLTSEESKKIIERIEIWEKSKISLIGNERKRIFR
jgi:hypothetical protein